MPGIEYGLLPTPQAMDGSVGKIHRKVFWRGKSPRKLSNQGIEGQAKLGETLAALGFEQHPNFVEWMMGYPMDFTKIESEHLETPSCHKSQHRS
jgi:hypothetical protein